MHEEELYKCVPGFHWSQSIDEFILIIITAIVRTILFSRNQRKIQTEIKSCLKWLIEFRSILTASTSPVI